MDEFPDCVLQNPPETDGHFLPWTIELLHDVLEADGSAVTKRTVERNLLSQDLLPPPLTLDELADEHGRPVRWVAAEHLAATARRERKVSLFVRLHETPSGDTLIATNDGRNARRWVFVSSMEPDDDELVDGLWAIVGEAAEKTLLWPHGSLCARFRKLADSDRKIAPT